MKIQSPKFSKQDAVHRHTDQTIVLIGSVILIGLRLLAYFVPSPLAWGLNYFSFLPGWVFIAYLLFSLLVVLSIRQLGGLKIPEQVVSLAKQPAMLSGLGILLTVLMALTLRVRIPLLGDSYILLNNFLNTFRGVHGLHLGREPLSNYFFYGVFKLANATTIDAMRDWFLIIELGLALVFIWCSYLVIRRLTEDPTSRLLLMGATVLLPWIQLFLGYVEIYSFTLTAVSIYLLTGLLYLEQRVPLYVPALAAIVMGAAHFLTGVLGLSMLFLAYEEYRRSGLRRIVIILGIAAFSVLGLVIGLGAQARQMFPDSPGSHLLSVAPSKDPYQAYTLFSVYHWIDLANLVILLCPFIGIFTYFLIRDYRRNHTAHRPLIFLGLGAAGYLLFLVFARFDLGAATDWDISAPYFFILTLVLAGSYLRSSSDRAPLVAAMIALCALQTLPWIYLNSTRQENFLRAENFLDRRIISQQGYYQSIMHFSMMRLQEGDSAAVPRLWEGYTKQFPNDWSGYQNLAYTTSHYDGLTDSTVIPAYERALALDSSGNVRRDYAAYCIDLSGVYARQGDVERAQQSLEKSIALNPDSPGGYNNLGLIYGIRGFDSLAIGAFHHAISLDSNFTMAYLGLGDFYLRKNNNTEATAWYRRGLAREQSPLLYERIAEAFNNLGTTDSVVVNLQRAARLGSQTAADMLRGQGLGW